MNHKLRLTLLSLVFFSFFFLKAQVPFSKGVNLTNWFQAGSARQIQFTKYTKEDFVQIKSLGCDVVRLPINLHFMTGGAPDYVIDPLFFDFLDQVVDWAEELQIHLLLDNHTFDPNANTEPAVEAVLLKVWPQMAEHFKNRSQYIYYEVLNEPHGITTALWCQIQQKVIDAIRLIDTKHTIVVGPSGYNGYGELKNMPVYTDTNLIYTFHFYDPFMFTHQGATWTDNMQDISGVPFPYVAAKMPAVPASAKGTWVESSMNNYKYDGTVAKVKQLIDIAVSFKNTRKVNLFCGEFGVYIPNSPNSDRVFWYDVVRKYLEEKGITWTIWDYQGGFGLFKKGSNEFFESDLNTDLLQSLGLNIPEQKVFEISPDNEPFDIFSDYIGKNIKESGNAGGGTIDYYDTGAQSGSYAIHWTGSSQYSGPAFAFQPNKNLAWLKTKNYELDFWVKGDTPGTKFQIRFVDSKTADPADHPWRMSYDIDQTKTTWDGTWQHLKIPLSSFKETGSWDNAWFSPIGKFDWTAINRLEIISEFNALGSQNIWFDEMKINGTPFTSVDENRIAEESEIKVFPNPFAGLTTISYTLPERSLVEVSIFNLSGQKLQVLTHGVESAGLHQVNWSPENLPKGIYLSKISASGKTKIVKLILN